MNSFWKNVLSSFLGSGLAMIIVSILLVLITFGIIGGLIASVDGSQKSTSVKEKTVLHLELDAPIIERGNENEFNFNFNTFQPENSIGLNHLLESIDKAADDSRIEGIYLNLSGVMAAPSSIEDIHQALIDFKSSGKWIMAYGEGFTQGAYYLSSVADEIYLYPEGGMEWKGLFTELAFFKQMLEKLDVDVQIIRGKNNKFKSAVEPFMYDHMSDANRAQVEKFLGTIWNDWVTDVAESRNMTVDQLNSIADSLSAYNPAKAVELGLIDGLKYPDEIMAMIKSKLELEEDAEPEFVTLGKYKSVKVAKANDEKDEEEDSDEKPSWKKDRIAVVYAVGGIESGEGDDETIGSDRIAKALRDAREDEDVKAIVLRVNSPGGSALASDIIWRETRLIKESGKPFVVSMGDVAASGGYYIACDADKIYANETTITGSIGVFGIVPVTGKFFENKMGVTFDRVQTNAHSNLMTMTTPLDDHEYSVIQESVELIYDRFLSIVADGRGMTKEQVDEIAQGRVWAGADALEIGLVDELGNLDDAIAHAAEMAGLEDYKTKNLPNLIDPFEEMMKELGGDVQANMIESTLGSKLPLYNQLKELEKLSKSTGVQARMPFFIDIR